MALSYDYNSDPRIAYGFSTDPKPTRPDAGTIFIETDTGNRFIYNGENWGKYVEPVSESVAENIKKTNQLSLRQISNRSNVYNSLSDGTEQAITYKMRHVVMENCRDLQLVYGNYYTKTNESDTIGNNDIIVSASIEYNGNIYPATFNGQTQITLKPGAIVKTDPIGIDVSKGDLIFTRNFVSVGSLGQKWPLGLVLYTARDEGKVVGDFTRSGTIPIWFGFSYHPLSIIGKADNSVAKVALFGDSIMNGNGDISLGIGFGVMACGTGMNGLPSISNPLPYMNRAQAGETATQFKNLGRRYRILYTENFTHAICEYGVNDITAGQTLDQIKTSLLNIWNALVDRGLVVYQTTITPRTTSTDGWITTQNQTWVNSAFASGNSIRNQLNEWIRTCPSPLTGIFDTTLAVETELGSGIWKPLYTADGTHPTTLGHTDMAKLVDISKFQV